MYTSYDPNAFLKLAWFFTVICCVVGMVCRKYPLNRLGGIGQPLPNPLCLVISILAYVPFAGLRTNSGDTFFYIHNFELGESNGKIDYFPAGGNLYELFSEIVKETVDDYHWLLFITAIITYVPVLYILYKYSHPFEMSVFLFMATGYFGMGMNGIRQYCAAGILILGTKFLFSTKKSAFLKYAAVVLVAWLFHKSALFMLPVFFFVRRKAWKPSSFMLIFISAVGLSIFDIILPSFLSALEDTSYGHYSDNGWFTGGQESGSSFLRVVAAAVPMVLAYFSQGRMRKLGHIGDILINLCCVHVAMYIISMYNWIFARFAIYTSAYYIILMAWVVYNAVSQKDRALYCTLCIGAFYYYSTQLAYALVDYRSDVFFPNLKFH